MNSYGLSDIADVVWVIPQGFRIRRNRRIPTLVLRDGRVVRLNFASSLSAVLVDRQGGARRGDPSDACALVSRVGGPSNPIPSRHLAIGIGSIGFAVLWIALWAGLAWSQSQQVRVEARVTAKSCHQSSDGEASTFTACVVSLIYTAPDGTPGVVQFHGVDANRIHIRDGQEALAIYFANKSSETPVNPQNNVPIWAAVLLVTLVGLPLGIGGVVYMRRGFRASAGSPHREKQEIQ